MCRRLLRPGGQAAIGDALVPCSERVDRALQHLLVHPPAGKPCSTPQRDRLNRIAAQTKANALADRVAIDDPDLIFRREGGGFNRLDRDFNGQRQPVLDAFNDALWTLPAASPHLAPSAKVRIPYPSCPRGAAMLAKITAKNQLTLARAITQAIAQAVGPSEYFDVQVSEGRIVLTPVRIQRGDAVRAKLAELNLSESDVDAAVAWARKR